MQTPFERKFLKSLRRYPEQVQMPDEDAVTEGFEYLYSDTYRAKPGAVKSRMQTMKHSMPRKDLLRLAKHMSKHIPSILSHIFRNYAAIRGYLAALEHGRTLPESSSGLLDSYPNDEIWQALLQYSWEKHRVVVGFTELPNSLIFKGKAVPFSYALVFVQEMQRQPIEKAPEIEAGMEVVNVYDSLGKATNDICAWLNRQFGIIGMANHPLGGLVDFVPLAEKAGMGFIGRSGLLITPQFGPRCRISPIFIYKPLFAFTDNRPRLSIQSFCAKCGKCVRACPKNAIYTQPVKVEGGKRVQAYDREACFHSFAATMGCGVCISQCPFSSSTDLYNRLMLQSQE